MICPVCAEEVKGRMPHGSGICDTALRKRLRAMDPREKAEAMKNLLVFAYSEDEDSPRAAQEPSDG